MNEPIPEQLDKILALADSCHEAEAVIAVRKARQILSRDGLSFGDLARAAFLRQRGSKTPRRTSFFSRQRGATESQIHHLHQQLEDLQAQMQTQDLQLDFWRRRALELEQNAYSHNSSETFMSEVTVSESAHHNSMLPAALADKK